MNRVVSNVCMRVAKAHGQVRTMGLSADAGTPSNVLAVPGFVARVGAVLAVFMLAFSLLVPTPPAHAYDSMRIWTHVKIDGDKIYVSAKTHALEQNGESTRSICTKDSTHAKQVNYLGAEVTKAEVEQYQGTEV